MVIRQRPDKTMNRTTSIEAEVGRELGRAAIGPETRVAVACSGGPDSVVLAHVVMGLARRGAVGAVTLVYVDHGLRPGTEEDARTVAALAAGGGASAVVLAADVDTARASLEDAAREARYAAIEAWCSATEMPWVLLAHTASDQAETVLMRIIRGTGVTGLAAIPRRRGRYLRPILGLPRTAIERYVTREGLTPVHDPMNDDPAFLRVRARRSLLPSLRAENPKLDAALCRLAASAREQREILDFAARGLLETAERTAGRTGWNVERLAAAPVAVAKRALYLAAEDLGIGPLEARHLAILRESWEQPSRGTVALDLPGGRTARIYDKLWLEVGAAPSAAPLHAAVTGPNPPYEQRCWRSGDRMRPERLMGRSRKLSDLFADARVPRSKRHHAVVIVRGTDGEIVWVEGLGSAWGSQVRVSLTSPRTMASNND